MAENKVNVDSQWVKENTAARGREWMGKQPENTQTALCRREQRDVWGNRAKARARVLNMGGIGGDRRVGGALARGSGHLKNQWNQSGSPWDARTVVMKVRKNLFTSYMYLSPLMCT